MGVQMTKELGVYNEEEKIHSPKLSTPTEPQRFRLLKDPRSATTGIERTPIQVEATPKSAKTVQGKEMTENKLNFNSESTLQLNCSEEENVSQKVENEAESENVKNSHTGTKFLETDIDSEDSPGTNADCSVTQNNGTKTVVELDDVRSPSLYINRTPILVECTPELFALHSRIESLSFCDIEVHTDDPSAIVSEDDQSVQLNQSSLINWLDDVEQKCPNNSPYNNSFADTPKTVARKQKEQNALKKKLFFTPDVNELTKPKVRTPLGNIQAGQLLESPSQMIRAKQWRNIKEERVRRGIKDTENTPPSLPPLLQVSSAPGKIADRKRSRTLWDDENTMLI